VLGDILASTSSTGKDMAVPSGTVVLDACAQHLGARNSRKAFHQNIGHFHYFLSEMYNSKY
jgi:hypothetical protein